MTDSTTPAPLDLDALRKIAEAATDGPWFRHDFSAPEIAPSPVAADVTVSCDHPATITVAHMGGGLHGFKSVEQARKDAAHIAAFDPPTVLALIAKAREAEALRAERDEAVADARQIVQTNLRAAAHISGLTDGSAMLRAEIATLTADLATVRAQLETVTARADAMQRDRATLSDKLNGTPCAEIGWAEEHKTLLAQLAMAREALEPFARLGEYIERIKVLKEKGQLSISEYGEHFLRAREALSQLLKAPK